ncbi:MAG TPA: cyclic nucleotide-binding domain-containing protein, partial [Ktedonobacteraceae bacterium]
MQDLTRSDLNQACQNCKVKNSGFCHLTAEGTKEFESIRYSSTYPAAAMLFLENESARGIYLLCSGQVKLSVSSSSGKTLILRIAKPGEMLGLTATMSGVPYEATAEVLHPAQVA